MLAAALRVRRPTPTSFMYSCKKRSVRKERRTRLEVLGLVQNPLSLESGHFLKRRNVRRDGGEERRREAGRSEDQIGDHPVEGRQRGDDEKNQGK